MTPSCGLEFLTIIWKNSTEHTEQSVVGGPRITDPRGSKNPPLPPHRMIRGSRITHPINPPPPHCLAK